MAIQIQAPPSTEAETQPRKLALTSIRPANLLSFAPDTEPLTLEPLNILIGANGSGKSNLLDAIGLLQAAAVNDLTERVVVNGFGVSEWIWKGSGAEKVASLEVTIPYPQGDFIVGNEILRYQLRFEEGKSHELRIIDERLEDAESDSSNKLQSYLFYTNSNPMVSPRSNLGPFQRGVSHSVNKHNPQESVLAQYWSSESYLELGYVSTLFATFRLYRDWSFGRNSAVRNSQRVGMLGDQLDENASNLVLVLNNLKDEVVGDRLTDYLKEFLGDARRVSTKIFGEYLQLGVSEGKLKTTTPAGRLSDGTLRWLALLAVLLHPTPPPLICLEEPESGLHPNIIPVLAELLLDASQRTQVVVTTHSRGLVDRFTDNPEYVVTFDKEDGATKMQRLPSIGELRDWLDEYESLGPLWASGLIGGNRF